MLTLGEDVYDSLIDHARESLPEEGCGVLAGEFGPERSRLDGSYRVENAASNPREEYSMDPEVLFAVLERLRGAGFDVVGFYHSHPSGPAAPSRTDVDGAAWDRRSYLVVSLAARHPFVGSWRWDADRSRFVREAIRLG